MLKITCSFFIPTFLDLPPDLPSLSWFLWYDTFNLDEAENLSSRVAIVIFADESYCLYY